MTGVENQSDGDNPPSVAGVGVHLPRYRIDADTIREAWGRFQASGIREKRVAGADEDALTMGATAAGRALAAAGVDGVDLASLAFATTTPPMAEEDPTPRLGEFLGAPASATRQTINGSTRAGTRALSAAIDAGRTPALVVAADCPRGEPSSAEDHAAGAGAVAFVLVEVGGATPTDRAEHSAVYPGTRFREAGGEYVEGLGIGSYDRQAFTECVTGAVEGVVADATGVANVDALALQAPDGKLPGRAAGSLDLDADLVTVAGHLGDLGAASAPMALARAWEEGAGSVLVVGYGSGAGADALRFEGTAPVEGGTGSGGGTGDEVASVTYPEYLRLRGEITGGPPAGGGAQVSVPSWRRSRAARYRLEAGACPECGALAFPPSGACPDCHDLVDYHRVELPRTGTVETATGISPAGAPPEFAPQAERGGDFGVAVVAFEHEGESASVPMQVTDAESGEVAHGDTVEAVIRRVYTQEGVTRYGMKARPVG